MSQTQDLIHAELPGRRIPAASNPVIRTLAADDVTLARHLEAADIPTLLMTVAHITGRMEILKDEWRPEIDITGVAQSGMTPVVEAEVRAFCLAQLIEFRERGDQAPARPTYDQLRRSGEWVMGPVIEPFLPLCAEELIATEEDPRQPAWSKQVVAPDRDFHVAIIGAGESGLAMAFRLKQAGVPFTIYEKNPEVGGTWLENHYPGCRVDVNSFLYSFAFARRTWKNYFAPADEVLEYLQEVARETGIVDHICFNSKVASATWNEQDGVWELIVDQDGRAEKIRSDMTVFAVGQLNRPKMPDIPGIGTFTGPAFHSARWDHDVDLNGKRIGIIGNGASAVQFIKEVAKLETDVSIFARTVNWFLPTPNLLDEVDESQRWLLDNVPNYAMWFRAAIVFPQVVGFLDHCTVDPNYPASEKAVSAGNNAIREAFTASLESQFADRPDLRDFLIPNSPVGAKRIVRDNGTWIETLKRDNVHPVNEGIEAITETGIRTKDGIEHELDVIIYGTGFHASQFLVPVEVTGRDGTNLHDTWQDDARAYVGMTVPKFPNMFMMYGPNTNLVVHGGSIIMFSELTANYIVDAARLLLEGGHQTMDVREQVFEDYNARVAETCGQLAFGYSKVNSWYKNSKGRVTQNFPFQAYEFWQRTHEVLATDYTLS